MMKLREANIGICLEDWACRFTPADIILHDLKSGKELREVSLVAVRYKTAERTGRNILTGEEQTFSHREAQEFLAVGREALAYAADPDAVVFSPLRRGQIAHYGAAEHMFRELLRRLSPKLRLMKPVVCVHVQEHTTEVEERAVIDLGVQLGARKVYLYQEPLSLMLDTAPLMQDMKHALIIHIEARDASGEE